MNRTHLAAFHAVAETGSFIRGAQRLMVGQPAVSSHVANLEAALKTALLERLPRGVRLTEAGRILLAYARQIASLELQAEQAVADLRGLARGALRIGATTTVGAYLLPKAIGQMKRLHPAVHVTLDIGNAAEIQDRLLDAQLDFAVTEGFVEHPALSARPVLHDRLPAIARPDHPWFSLPTLNAKMLSQLTLILREPGSGTRAVVERALQRKRVKLRDTLSIGSTEAIKQAVLAGLGVAIVSAMTIEHELAAGVLRALPIADLSVERDILLTTVKGRPFSAATNAFLPLLHATGKTHPRRP